MRISYWNPSVIEDEVVPRAMERLEGAARVLAEKTRANLRKAIKHSYSRPPYKTGPYAGRSWTAREAGALEKTVRVVRKYGDANGRNVRVYVGNYDVYYAQIFEFSLPPKGKAFFRPAINASRAEMKDVIQNGTGINESSGKYDSVFNYTPGQGLTEHSKAYRAAHGF